MASGEPVTGPPADDPSPRLAESARGWHTIQLAVLGFIGICGVLHTSGPTTPGLVRTARQVDVPLQAVAQIRSVSGCP